VERRDFLFTAIMKRSFIVTAGGIGKRMGTKVPKQFLLLNDKPILMHTMENLHRFDKVAELVVTLPEEYIEYWHELTEKHDFRIVHTIVEGGEERFYSFQNALPYCNGKLIAVHDAVRPFIDHKTLENLFAEAEANNAVVPVIPVRESLRKKEEGGSKAVNRSKFFIVQTPQVFKRMILIDAYHQDFSSHFTDDASVVEANGNTIHLVEGNEENIKITSPMDLIVAEAILKNRKH